MISATPSSVEESFSLASLDRLKGDEDCFTSSSLTNSLDFGALLFSEQDLPIVSEYPDIGITVLSFFHNILFTFTGNILIKYEV